MPYTINKYNGAQVTVVADGTIDSTLDIKLIGKNYAGYGEVQNENFVFMLENFANNNPPPKPVSGQIWFDSSSSKLKFYDGTKFRTTGGAEIASVAPTGLTVGDFWWDTGNEQLYSWNGLSFVLVGPQGRAGNNTTEVKSVSVRDVLGGTHSIIKGIVDRSTIFVVSTDDEFELDIATNEITGFTKIHKGITLRSTNEASLPGQTTDNHRFYGTATNADRLGGDSASAFVRATSAEFSTLVNFADVGYTVGNPNARLKVFNDGELVPTIYNQLSDTIVFKTTVSSSAKTPLKLVGLNILPGETGTSDIGSNVLKFSTVYATTFNGVATNANALNVAGDYRSASIASSPNTVAIRDASSDIYASKFQGVATSAQYADLAEKYLADDVYEVGTVLMVGGEKEVTLCQVGFRAVGPVSENPAHLMNNGLVDGTAIALKGRVPVKMTGNVIKGQRLVAGPSGTAQAAMGNTADCFAIALETNNEPGVRLVECLIL